MNAGGSPPAGYEAELRGILAARDWQGLREFSQRHNQIPADVYEQPEHFWTVMLHKLTCSRIDLLGLHDDSRKWLEAHGYSTDPGGY